MIHGKDRLQEYKRRMHAERKELQQATRSFITSVFRTGVSVALFPVSRLPRKPQQHPHAAGCEFTRGLASLAHGFADGLEEMTKETNPSTTLGVGPHTEGNRTDSEIRKKVAASSNAPLSRRKEHSTPTKTPRINRLVQLVRFLRVSRLLFWTIWVIYHERRRVVRVHARGNYEERPDSDVLIEVLAAFRETALELGVLMIKLGQFLSSRVDLLPEQAIVLLSSMQDEVPPAPFDHVVSVIESELGKPVEEVFSMLERKCTAAASLGQVHKAVLASTGETVAVKIQRPGIEQLARMDLSTLKFVIWIITRFVDVNGIIDLMGVYHEFQRTIYEEIDYVREAANARRFKEMFKDDPMIYIPRVYDQYASRHMLVLEWIDGIKINDYAALNAAGINRLEVAKRTVCAYFYQFFEAGFFHADPHPGNIFVKKGSAGDRPIITFVDFGMVGSLTKHMKKFMKDVFLAYITRDAHSLVHALSQLGFIDEGANLDSIERAMSLMIERYHGMTLAEVSELDLLEIVQDVEYILYEQHIQIPAQFAFTGRAVSILAGISTGLAPEFNFIEVAAPYARKFMGLDIKGIEQTLRQTFNQLLDAGRVLLKLPRSLEQIITRLESGQIEVKITNNEQSGRRRLRRPRSERDNGESSGV
jgi:predicted unusual protein kinase regulating ubiquinone biosynthesis (AarF/ABC1/UbiB family)